MNIPASLMKKKRPLMALITVVLTLAILAIGLMWPTRTASGPGDTQSVRSGSDISDLSRRPPGMPGGLETALSVRLIAITTDFTGADVLIFGLAETTDDIAVVVRGPFTDATVRRKQRMVGIWANAEARDYKNVPAYYHLASNRPLAEFVSQDDRRRLQLGLGQLRPAAADSQPGDADFGQALVEDMVRRGLYSESASGVEFVGSRLFRLDLRLPPNVPVGTFMVDVHAFRNGALHGMNSTNLSVGKIGIGAAIYNFAHGWPALYGILAVAAAMGLGGLAASVFRKA